MTTEASLKKIREIILTNNNNEFDDTVSEDEESNSDLEYCPSETESDDISTESILKRR
jgi:hypothetical protein